MQEQLRQAIIGGNVPLVIGIVLPAIVAFIASILQGKVASKTYRIMSLVRSVTTAGCMGMSGAALADPDSWWMGLALAVFGLQMSQTTIDEIRGLIPDRSEK